tara:strand:+ start:31 stop:3606 length:3576 start_codon:yes stop_codon:yes gene_type:complete
LATFEQFYKSLSSNSQVRGKEFEKLVKWFLKTEPRWNNLVKEIWLWDEHPQRDEWGPDCGIDLVFEDLIGNNWAVQAKCFDSHNSIRKEHMDSFIAESSDSRFQKRLLVTSTDNIGPNVERLLSRHKVVKILLEDLVNADLEYPENPINFKNAKRKDPPKPYPHQEEAIKDVLNGLKDNDKGQVLMACGTGKTLTALWIKERLKAENVLVLLPSLSLLSQTLKEWNKASKDKFKWICVCSDKSVAKEDKSNDDWISNTSDIGIPVTSSTDDIKKFIFEKGSKIIFSTYQSSPLIVDAQKDSNIPPFEIIFADEAHRCAGKVSKAFSCVLDEKKIRSKKRLFFTATPIVLSNQIKGKAEINDIEVASMDEESIFGNVLHELKFSDAINNNPPLLTDYQVVVVAVDDPMIRQQIINRDLLTTDGENIIDAERVAAKIALIKSIKEFDLRRIISFHGLVKNAKQFAEDLNEINNWMPEKDRPKERINCEYVSGTMKTFERNNKLKRLKNINKNERRLLTNARCLSEGVDVPALDGIAFIDPKSSQIDIIQAVGRAIRKSKDKTIGTIVIPVYIGETDDLEEELIASKFKHVWQIILALKSQDDSLMQTIDRLRISLGENGGSISRGGGLEKIIIIPEKINYRFSESIKTLLIRNTSENWYESYGKLIKFFKENNERSPSQESKLGKWVNLQRQLYKKNKLTKSRIDDLNKLEKWVWDEIEAIWEENFNDLKSFVIKNKHACPHTQNTVLGRWVVAQRVNFNKGTLSQNKVNRLNTIDYWTWDPIEDEWQDNFKKLVNFEKENGHSRPQYGKSDLGNWVTRQRTQKKSGKLPKDKERMLESLKGWTWDMKKFQWDSKFEELKNFEKINGHANPTKNETLMNWVRTQRRDYNNKKLSIEKINLLESLKYWIWDKYESDWMFNYQLLIDFVNENNHGRPPVGVLSTWMERQRANYRRNKMTREHIDLLEKIEDWTWDPNKTDWDSNFELLKEFINKNGHANPPQDHPKIGSFVSNLRTKYRNKSLSSDVIKKVEELDFWTWNTKESNWSDNYKRLKEYAAKNGHARPFKNFPVIGKWVSMQRKVYNKNKLSEERINLLEKLPGWVWDVKEALWMENYLELLDFVKKNGHARPSRSDKICSFVDRQRKNFKDKKLSQNYIDLLNKVDHWLWDASDLRATKKIINQQNSNGEGGIRTHE